MENMTEEKNDLLKPPRPGEIIKGSVIGVGRSSLFVDLGQKGTGIIYGREFYESKPQLRVLKKGDEIFAKVIELDNEQGYIELSLKEAGQELAWEKLLQKKENKESFPVKISGANRGGLISEIEGVQAFLPVSQLSFEHYPRIEGGETSKILKELQQFVGKELKVRVFDLDPKENKLILSEKATESQKIKEILKGYKVGDTVEGDITGVVNFGAFMKFQLKGKRGKEKEPSEIEGLIHISELDWQMIEDPLEIVKVGQKVKAKIIEIADDKVSLSLKALKKDPWQGIEKKYKKGDVVKGEVSKLNPFGAFVEITDKIQGLCHISEFGTRSKMEQALETGKSYDFEILQIEPENHRMTLKLASQKTQTSIPEAPILKPPGSENQPPGDKEDNLDSLLGIV